MSTVEVRVAPAVRKVGDEHKSYWKRSVHIDGNDISADVLSVLVSINNDGSVVTTLDLVASLVDMAGDSDSVQLTNATVAGLNAMGWRTDDQVREAIEGTGELLRLGLIEAMDELGIQAEADGRVDFDAVQTALQAAIGNIHAEGSQ